MAELLVEGILHDFAKVTKALVSPHHPSGGHKEHLTQTIMAPSDNGVSQPFLIIMSQSF